MPPMAAPVCVVVAHAYVATSTPSATVHDAIGLLMFIFLMSIVSALLGRFGAAGSLSSYPAPAHAWATVQKATANRLQGCPLKSLTPLRLATDHRFS